MTLWGSPARPRYTLPQAEALRTKGKSLRTTVAFLAETAGSASVKAQQECLDADDIRIFAGRKTFSQLGDLLARKGIRLVPGDRIKVHDLSCLSLTTPMLIRALAKLLKSGISFELCSPGIVIEPSAEDRVHTFLAALDDHNRHIHGIKTHPPEMAQAGRKRLLDPDKLPEIRARLSEPGATTTDVALSLGVARSTLFNYLERYDLERRANRQKKDVSGGSDDTNMSMGAEKGL
jgi:DNA invertase Pin-like site-specific DNA recombinase